MDQSQTWQAEGYDAYQMESLNAWEYSVRNDGWWAAFLLFSILFGPETQASALLPPIRFADFAIVLLCLLRWTKANCLYGGFIYGYHLKLASIPITALSIVILISVMFNTLTGELPFFFKNFFYPIHFIRMGLIAAIGASFYFGPRQLRQFAWGVIVFSFVLIVLSFVQKNTPWLVSGILEKMYAIEYKRLGGSRVVGTFGNPNRFGFGLSSLAAIMLAIGINTKGMVRFLSLGAYVFLGLSILIATGSRTGFVGFLAVTCLCMLLSLQGKARVYVLFLAPVFIVGYLYVSANIDKWDVHPRMKVLIGGSDNDTSVGEALYSRQAYFWTVRFGEAMKSPIIGVGGDKATYQVSDNGYIMMIMRGGLIGLSVYVFFLFSLVYRGVKGFIRAPYQHQKALILGMFAVVMNLILFEITGDFLWNPQTSALFSASVGVLCGTIAQGQMASHQLGMEAY